VIRVCRIGSQSRPNSSERPPARYELGKSGKRSRSDRYTVKYLPPPWKRSLTESGMFSRTTPADVAIVIAFFVGLMSVLVWAATSIFGA
jgi:hypothetical protein